MSSDKKSTRQILMGDPTHFSVQGGANPHTRTRWGTRRHVDRTRAIEQWHNLKNTLEDLDIRVIVAKNGQIKVRTNTKWMIKWSSFDLVAEWTKACSKKFERFGACYF